ncbi:MAG: hypothetical protein KAS77_00605, partial [Thermoplasmata archaeon]|nr:hypothetical protein [Thermoplasmata archaeon]
MFRVTGSTAKTIIAILVVAVLALPTISVAIPVDRPALLPRDRDSGEVEPTRTDLEWPVRVA